MPDEVGNLNALKSRAVRVDRILLYLISYNHLISKANLVPQFWFRSFSNMLPDKGVITVYILRGRFPEPYCAEAIF